MNTIRPTAHSPLQGGAAQRPQETAKTAAARAFFELAAGKAPAAPAATVAAQTTSEMRAAAPTQRVIQAPVEQPTRPMRPGSFLDIRV